MTSRKQVSIFGLGLMGGSLARDLAALGWSVAATDSSEDVIEAAMSEGVVSERIDADAEVDGIVVIATSVDTALKLLDAIAPRLAASAVVTDLGSTKSMIADRAGWLGIAERFVGSHPLAGYHESGWAASRRDLYQGAKVFVCPGEGTAPEARSRIEEMWSAVGGEPRAIGAEEHDRLLAWISHMPQVVATALANALDSAGLAPSDLGPGGKDMTRLAASSPEMWKAISASNHQLITVAIDALESQLDRYRKALKTGSDNDLHDFFRSGRDWRS